MSFVKLSSELAISSAILLDNLFVLEHMPYAPESYTKVYIYGKTVAASCIAYDNSIARMAKLLALTEDEVLDAFAYWAEKGLVTITLSEQPEIEYLPVHHSRPSSRKFSKTKYTPFNEQLLKMFPRRDFTPSEYNEYYSVIEDYRIDTDAMLCIFSYCARQKGENVGWRYIVTVARNLAKEGCRTAEEVEKSFAGMSKFDDGIKQIFKALKLRRKPDLDDKQLYKTWILEYGFELNGILRLAAEVFNGEMRGLDSLVKRYYLIGINTFDGIDIHIVEHEKLISLTKELLIKLDVRFTRLDHYADSYVEGWLKQGFSRDALLVIADYCFRHERKSCEAMSGVVEKFKTLDLLTADELANYFADKVRHDDEIKTLLLATKSDKRVSARDRELFRTWLDKGISRKLIDFAAQNAVGFDNPLAYINKLVTNWQESGVTTAEEAAKHTARKPEPVAVTEIYNADELNAKLMSINLEDI